MPTTCCALIPLLAVLACGPKAEPAGPGPATSPGPDTEQPGPANRTPIPPAAGADLPEGDVGGEGPVVIEGAAADGSWVLMCQAREDTDGDGSLGVNVGYHGDLYGDAMASYLVVGGGAGEKIDDLVAMDPAGGHLVVKRDDALLLVHPGRDVTVDLTALGADATDDGSPFYGHRAASFDQAGDHLVYLREVDGRTHAVVRALADGRETVVDPGEGNLWRAMLGPTGAWLSLWVIATDTDGDGQLTWPRVRTSLSGRRCRGPISSYSTGGASGDQPVTRFARVGKSAREITGFVGFLGEAILARDPGGSLVLDYGNGAVTEIVPADCGGRVEAVDTEGERVVVVCTGGGEPERRLYSRAAEMRSLGSVSDVPSDDRLAPFHRHVLVSGKDLNTIVIDADTGARRKVDAWQRVLAIAGDNTLVNRDGALVLLSGDGERVLADMDDDYPDVHVTGHAAVANQYVVDVEAGALLGEIEGTPLAITGDGAVLVAPAEPQTSRDIPSGPLRWVRPE